MDFTQRRRVTPHGDLSSATRHGPDGLGGLVKNLRKPRQQGLLQAIHRLDVGLDQASREELARWIRDEYVAEIGDLPLGFVAQCQLGAPYVDHVLDLSHSIVEHYAAPDVMPEPFAQARMLARTGAYAFVEVYVSGTVVPVLSDGSVVA